MARVWLPKPIYESLPYYYLVAGVISLGAALYLDFWYWPYIGVTAGFACLVAGLVVWLRRKDFRNSAAQAAGEPPQPGPESH
ncbi:MAG: hypothetical protein V3T51_03380 [Gammaproteobacteria bacterium]